VPSLVTLGTLNQLLRDPFLILLFAPADAAASFLHFAATALLMLFHPPAAQRQVDSVHFGFVLVDGFRVTFGLALRFRGTAVAAAIVTRS